MYKSTPAKAALAKLRCSSTTARNHHRKTPVNKKQLDRRTFLGAAGAQMGAALLSHRLADAAEGEERPNILWVVSEDTSPYLGCYGHENATTPNLDQLASEGVRYENAFADAPVCAPARCTLITGMNASSLGTHHMRSRYAIPDFARYLPLYLREAGYYCTNNAKEDYNTHKAPGTWSDAWHESSGNAHYRKREKGQPFFSVFNYHASHESTIFQKGGNLNHDPQEMKLPPYHPDLPEVRRDWAEYFDGIQRIDRQIGRRLDELGERGVADNTIVFYYGDHGGVLARSKRYLFDSGTRVPLIVRFPPKWQHLAPAPPGSSLSRPVSFVDFGPSVFSLAGVDVPDHMEGRPFLGQQAEPSRDYAYLFRGRMDERYDMMRGVRGRRYLYIRNYMPHRVYGQHLRYLWRAQSTRAWQQAYRQGKCNETQSRFWETKPPEELYDIEEDPHNVDNLAEDPAHEPVLKQMRRANLQHLREIRDAGFLPEAEMLRRAEQQDCTPYRLAERSDFPLNHIIDTAEKATMRTLDHLPTLLERMDNPDSGVRYWAATGCAVLAETGEDVSRAVPHLKARLQDEAPDVRVTAAEALCRTQHLEEGLAALEKALKHDRNKVALRAVNVVQSLGEPATPLLDAVRDAKGKGGYVNKAAHTALETLG